MGYNANRIKERAAEFEDQYNDTMIKELNEQLDECIKGEDVVDIDPDDIMEIVTEWKNKLPDIGDWCFTQVDNELSDIGDQQRDAERDRAWEEQDE